MAQRAALDAAIAHAKELFADLGAIRSRKMFGGAALYADGRLFALIAFDEVFLKADGAFAEILASEGSRQFSYEGKGKPIAMKYWTLPEDAMDDPDLAVDWALRALAAQ